MCKNCCYVTFAARSPCLLSIRLVNCILGLLWPKWIPWWMKVSEIPISKNMVDTSIDNIGVGFAWYRIRMTPLLNLNRKKDVCWLVSRLVFVQVRNCVCVCFCFSCSRSESIIHTSTLLLRCCQPLALPSSLPAALPTCSLLPESRFSSSAPHFSCRPSPPVQLRSVQSAGIFPHSTKL